MLLKLNCYMLDSLGKLTRVYSRPASTQALQMLLPTGTAIFQLFEPELTGQETHKSVNHRFGFCQLPRLGRASSQDNRTHSSQCWMILEAPCFTYFRRISYSAEGACWIFLRPF
jgi:hypothetical protein